MKIDWTTMILAIVISVFLWAYVHVTHRAPEITRTIRDVPVQPIGKIAPGFTYRLHEDSRTVDVQIKGPVDRVNNVVREEIAVRVDLARITRAQKTILKPEVHLPHGVRLVGEETVTLTVVPSKQKLFPVTVAFIAQPRPGTTVGDYLIEPATVTVEGGAEDLDLIKYVTVRLDPNQPLTADRDFIPNAVDAEGKAVEGARVLTSVVKVHMASLTGEQVTRQVAVGKPTLKNAPRHYVVRVTHLRPEQVTLSGERALLDRAPAYVDTEPLDVSRVVRDTTLTARLKVPRGLLVVEGPTVRVDVEVQPLR